MSAAAPQVPRPRRRRLRRAGLVLVAAVLALALLTGGGVIYLTGRPISAPDWLRTRIETRLAQEFPQTRVDFGELTFVVDTGWRPRIRLRDVTVALPTGEEVVRFNELKASFAMEPLLRGRVQPRDIALSGAVATLRRLRDGSFSLSAGLGPRSARREAPTLPHLVGQMDALLDSSALRALTDVELRALTLRYEDVRAGLGWTVDGGRALLTRRGDALSLQADLALLSGGASAATLSADYTSEVGRSAATFGVAFDGVVAQDIAAQGPVFAWLDVLRAQISGSVRAGLDAAGKLTPLAATLQIGPGALQPNEGTQPIPFNGARSSVSYDFADRILRFDEVSVDSAWVSGHSDGTAALQIGGDRGPLTALVGQFRLRDLVANPLDLYPRPVSLEGADVDFQLKLDPFRLEIGQLRISDQGKTLLVDGEATATPDGWTLAIDGQMDALAPDRLLALWPQRVGTKTRDWLQKNILDGTVSDIDFALRRAPDAAPKTYLGLAFDEASVKFMRFMPPVTKGRGQVSLYDNRLVVTVDEGMVVAPEGGEVTLAGSSFIMPDVTVKDGPPAVIRLETQSSLTAALSLVNQKPMEVMDKVNLPVTLAEGRAALTGTIATNLKKGIPPEQVRYHFEGDLLSLETDQLIKGRTLASPRLGLTVTNDELVISGQASLDSVDFDGAWTQPIGPGADKSALRGTIAVTPAALEAFKIALPPGTLAGSGTATIAVDLQKGRAPDFRLDSDLRGLRVAVPQLSWVKPAGTAGKLRVAGALGPVPRIDTLAVSGPGLSARGSVALREGGGLDRVRFDRIRRADWLDVPVDLIGQGAGRPVQVVLRGGMLDLRRAKFGKTANGPPGPPMIVALDRLEITDSIALTGLSGTFDTARGVDGAFEAQLNGGVPVQGRVVPQNGRSAVRLVSDDAGGVLRSAGLVQTVVGGDLSLTLLPVGSGGAFDGLLTVGDVRIKQAPAIVGLVNAVSVVGLVNELNGDGIYFDDVEAAFRLTPDRLTLTQASAVGASMGLSMEGVYAMDSKTIDLQGVFSPVYLLNGIGAVLTRRGEGLIGFNYTLKGPAKSPAVSVNPLSALTPGMFREIFRAPPPDLPPVEGVTGSTLPQQAPAPERPVVRSYQGR